MANVIIICGLLVAPYLAAYLFHFTNSTMAGRMGLCAVFLFTAIGHFFKTDSMIPMLPPFVPWRRALIYLSGIVEVLFAVRVVALHNPSYVGWIMVLCLIAIFPSNIYAVVHRISFGGHSMGPGYLFVRFPLQLLLPTASTSEFSVNRFTPIYIAVINPLRKWVAIRRFFAPFTRCGIEPSNLTGRLLDRSATVVHRIRRGNCRDRHRLRRLMVERMAGPLLLADPFEFFVPGPKVFEADAKYLARGYG